MPVGKFLIRGSQCVFQFLVCALWMACRRNPEMWANLDYGEEKPVKNGLAGSLVTVVCVSFTTQGRRQTIISLGTMEKNWVSLENFGQGDFIPSQPDISAQASALTHFLLSVSLLPVARNGWEMKLSPDPSSRVSCSEQGFWSQTTQVASCFQLTSLYLSFFLF